MKSLFLLAILWGADPLPDGTVVVLENCNSVVEFTTRGSIGHVALAMSEGGDAWIYEATPAQVRRVSVDQYYLELARLNERRKADDRVRVWAMQPKETYTSDETAAMREYLDSQLGRRYSLKNYVLGQPGDGIHCGELAASTLNRSGRFMLDECEKLHPAALCAQVQPLYQERVAIEISAPTVRETWCARTQRRWSGWFTWCGWSCEEALSYCW
jgi:hypothetical protein